MEKIFGSFRKKSPRHRKATKPDSDDESNLGSGYSSTNSRITLTEEKAGLRPAASHNLFYTRKTDQKENVTTVYEPAFQCPLPNATQQEGKNDSPQSLLNPNQTSYDQPRPSATRWSHGSKQTFREGQSSALLEEKQPVRREMAPSFQQDAQAQDRALVSYGGEQNPTMAFRPTMWVTERLIHDQANIFAAIANRFAVASAELKSREAKNSLREKEEIVNHELQRLQQQIQDIKQTQEQQQQEIQMLHEEIGQVRKETWQIFKAYQDKISSELKKELYELIRKEPDSRKQKISSEFRGELHNLFRMEFKAQKQIPQTNSSTFPYDLHLQISILETKVKELEDWLKTEVINIKHELRSRSPRRMVKRPEQDKVVIISILGKTSSYLDAAEQCIRQHVQQLEKQYLHFHIFSSKIGAHHISEDYIERADFVILIAVPEPRDLVISHTTPSQLGMAYRKAMELNKKVIVILCVNKAVNLMPSNVLHEECLATISSQNELRNLHRRNQIMSVAYNEYDNCRMTLNSAQADLLADWLLQDYSHMKMK